jgi:flagellar biosynthesis protein FliP
VTRSAARAARLAPLVVLLGLLLVLWAPPAAADVAEPVPPTPPTEPSGPAAPEIEDVAGVTVTVDGAEDGLSRTVTLVLLLTVAAVAPVLLLLMTTFTRFVVVLSLVRNGLGLQTVPPAQVLIGLAFFLSMFAMGPTLSSVNEAAVQPMLAGEMDALEAAEAGYEPMREFMLSQTREADLRMFVELSADEAPASPDEIGPTTLVPAFVISELRTAFTIGFVIFVPFLVIAPVLMSMGMVMLPPIFVSLPLKLLLFVLVDGWALISRSLINSVIGG